MKVGEIECVILYLRSSALRALPRFELDDDDYVLDEQNNIRPPQSPGNPKLKENPSVDALRDSRIKIAKRPLQDTYLGAP